MSQEEPSPNRGVFGLQAQLIVRHAYHTVLESGHVKYSVLVPYPVLAGMRMQRTLYLYARHVTWDIQTIASCFVKRRDHPQEFTLIVDLL